MTVQTFTLSLFTVGGAVSDKPQYAEQLMAHVHSILSYRMTFNATWA